MRKSGWFINSSVTLANVLTPTILRHINSDMNQQACDSLTISIVIHQPCRIRTAFTNVDPTNSNRQTVHNQLLLVVMNHYKEPIVTKTSKSKQTEGLEVRNNKDVTTEATTFASFVTQVDGIAENLTWEAAPLRGMVWTPILDRNLS